MASHPKENPIYLVTDTDVYRVDAMLEVLDKLHAVLEDHIKALKHGRLVQLPPLNLSELDTAEFEAHLDSLLQERREDQQEFDF